MWAILAYWDVVQSCAEGKKKTMDIFNGINFEAVYDYLFNGSFVFFVVMA